MSQQYFIGIDGGTQSSKVCIFDMQGRIVSEGHQKLKPMHRPKQGVAEHPEDDLWDSLAIASRQAMASFQGEAHQIKGIGLCSIRCCRAELKEDGRLVGPVLSWMDQRLNQKYQAECESARYVTTASGYLTHRLTGEFKDTSANYEGQWPIDKKLWGWSEHDKDFDRVGLTRAQLFGLVNPGEVLGEVTMAASIATGFPEGLPVIATANDKAVEALGAGLNSPGAVLISLGTYIGAMFVGTGYQTNGASYFINMACEPFKFLYETGGVRFGMSTITWLKELFGMQSQTTSSEEHLSAEDVLNDEASKLPLGSDGLITIPEWLAPQDKQFKKGVMLGLHAGHTRAHLYRSALEGIALTMKNHIDESSAELGIEINRMIVSGGGANSDLFMQILADVMGTSAQRNLITGSAALGSAICAAVATGAYPSFEQAQAAMVHTNDEFEPNLFDTKLYEKINQQVFSKVASQTDSLLNSLHSINNPINH